jgi:hypothetical protein
VEVTEARAGASEILLEEDAALPAWIKDVSVASKWL